MASPSLALLPPPSHVLVVDDDEAIRNLLQRKLERAGFAVITASDGSAGVRCCREYLVALVVTDLRMPGMNGLELIRTLTAEKPDIPIIAFSGADDAPQQLRVAAASGAKAVMSTPVMGRDLETAVRQMLATY